MTRVKRARVWSSDVWRFVEQLARTSPISQSDRNALSYRPTRSGLIVKTTSSTVRSNGSMWTSRCCLSSGNRLRFSGEANRPPKRTRSSTSPSSETWKAASFWTFTGSVALTKSMLGAHSSSRNIRRFPLPASDGTRQLRFR